MPQEGRLAFRGTSLLYSRDHEKRSCRTCIGRRRRSRARARGQVLRAARRAHDVDRVVAHAVVEVNLPRFALPALHVLERCYVGRQYGVGRAEAVQVEYRGRPVNLKPYVNTKGVARLTIADSRATSGGQSSR